MASQSHAVAREQPPRQPQALRHAFTVLEAIAELGPGVSAQELTEVLGLSRATCYGLLHALVEQGYIVRTRGRFWLGPAVKRFAELLPRQLPRAGRELLREVRESTRGGIHLARYAGARIVVIDEDADFPLADPTRLRRQLDASAFGRLLLAEGELESVLSLAPRAPAAELRALTTRVRSDGFATQEEQFAQGRGCIAWPVRDEAGRLIAALSFSGRLEHIRQPERILPKLAHTATALADVLA